MELLLLIAIAYAGARGVEALVGTEDRRNKDRSEDAEKTVKDVAASGPKDGKAKKPGPTERGGTFAKAAPRAATVGGKAAVPVAVVLETGSTMWKAVGEGYREAIPTLREQHRAKMADRAERRRTEKEAAGAKKKADEAAAKAGPPPPHPPKPTEAPAVPEPAESDGAKPDGGEEGDGRAHVITTVPEPRTAPDDAERERADAAEAKAEAARKEAETVRAQAATDKVLAAQQAERDAKEREAAAEERAREAEARATEADADRRRHLSVVPTSTEETGALMSSPSAIIPEVRTLDGLLNAFTLLNAMSQMRAEEAEAIAADDLALSNRLEAIEAELAELEVDPKTRVQVDDLRESIFQQFRTAKDYSEAAVDAADLAKAAAGAAHKSHGGIAEAVQSSPIERAAQAGYYER